MSGTKYVPADLFDQAVKGGKMIGGETNFPAVKIGDTTLTAAGQDLALGISLGNYYPADGVAASVNRQAGLEVNADTGGTDLNGDVYVAAIKGNFVLDTTSSNASIIGVLGMLNSNTYEFGSGGHFAVRGHVDFWGSSNIAGASDYVGAIDAYVENEATTTIDAGNYLCGIRVYQVGGSPSIASGAYNPAILVMGSNSTWAQTLSVVGAMHCIIDSMDDTKNIRMNSRNLTASSGSHTGVQIKPRVNVTGTVSVTGLEVAPGFNASMAGSGLRGIVSCPVVKAGTGNLTGGAHSIEASFDFGTSGTRSITGDISALYTFLAIPSTYTYSGGHVAVIRVGAVNIKSWDYFLNFDDATNGCLVVGAGTYSTADGYIKMVVADTAYRIPFFTATDG